MDKHYWRSGRQLANITLTRSANNRQDTWAIISAVQSLKAAHLSGLFAQTGWAAFHFTHVDV